MQQCEVCFSTTRFRVEFAASLSSAGTAAQTWVAGKSGVMMCLFLVRFNAVLILPTSRLLQSELQSPFNSSDS